MELAQKITSLVLGLRKKEKIKKKNVSFVLRNLQKELFVAGGKEEKSSMSSTITHNRIQNAAGTHP